METATHGEEAARQRLDTLPGQDPFTLRYETLPPVTEDWESCAVVLGREEKKKKNALLRGW